MEVNGQLHILAILYPVKWSLGTHYTKGLVIRSTSLDVLAEKYPCLSQESSNGCPACSHSL